MKNAFSAIAFVCALAFVQTAQGQDHPIVRLGVSGFGQDSPVDLGVKPQPIVDLDEGKVEEATKDVAPEGKAETLVVMSATWCINCKPLVATAEKLKDEGYDVTVIKIDTDEGKEKWKKFSNIKNEKGKNINQFWSVPTTFYIRDGMIVKKEVGVKTKRHILSTLWKVDEEESNLDKFRNRLPWNN